MPLTLKTLGLRTDNLTQSFIPYILLALILLSGLAIFLHIGGQGLRGEWVRLYGTGLSLRSIFLVALFAIPQEVFFRGFLVPFLKERFGNVLAVVVIDAFLFGALHVAFASAAVLVPEAFLAGLCFAAVYYYYPNLYLASVAHTVLNLCVIVFCGMAFASC